MPGSGLRRGALSAAFAFVLFTWSCTSAVPPVPTPRVEGFDAAVGDAILTAYQQATADPSSAQASGRLGMVLQAHAIYPEAVLCYQRAIRLDPKEFSWRYYLAVVYQQLSDTNKALETLNRALRMRPDYAPAILRKADLLFQRGRFRESGDSYNSMLAADPGSAAALYGVARVKYAQRDMLAAEDFYGRACRAYQTFGAAYYGLAMAQKTLGKAIDSNRNLDLAQRFGADQPVVRDPLAEQVAAMATGVYSQLARGDQLARRGRMEEAAQLNQSLLKKDPQNFTVLLNLLFLSRFLDSLDAQVDGLFASAKQINPRVPLVYDYYGASLVRQGKYDAAAGVLRKAIELMSDYAEAHGFLGEVLERENRANDAIAEYQSALSSQPSDRSLQMRFWRLLIIQGRAREAVPPLMQALQVEDNYSTLRLVLLAEAYRTLGEVVTTRQYLEQARARALREGPPQLLAQIDQELAQTAARP